MSLPQRLDLNKMQTTWATQLDPIIQNQLVNGILLPSQVIANGVTVINHRLSRQLQGWFITDINGAAQIYRSQPKNDKTLTLTSNAAVTADIWVF